MLHRGAQLPITVHANKGAALPPSSINQRCLAFTAQLICFIVEVLLCTLLVVQRLQKQMQDTDDNGVSSSGRCLQ
jgi:hypothetical protein